MKKQYINPKTDIVEIELQHQMMAGSELGLGADGDANYAEGRQSNGFWDEEE